MWESPALSHTTPQAISKHINSQKLLTFSVSVNILTHSSMFSQSFKVLIAVPFENVFKANAVIVVFGHQIRSLWTVYEKVWRWVDWFEKIFIFPVLQTILQYKPLAQRHSAGVLST